MFQYRQSLFLSWLALSLISLSGLISCGPAMRGSSGPSDPKWTVENPLATRGGSQGAGQGRSQTAARDSAIDSGSLEQMRRGESPATSPASPLKDINFAFDSYDLDAAAREALKGNADWLRANPSATVQIEGHCDERGTNQYNLALGARRAAAAKDYLASLGVDSGRLSTISYGEEVPVCRESTEGCWAKNRRGRFVAVRGAPRL